MHPLMNEIEFVDQVYSMVRSTPIAVVSSFFFDSREIVFGRKISSFILKPLTLEKLIESTKSIWEAPEAGKEEKTTEAEKELMVDQVISESKKLTVLLEISRSINSKTSLDEVLDSIVKLAGSALEAERATLFIVDRQENILWSKSGTGIKQQEIKVPLGKGIAGEVAVKGISQIIDDPYSHPGFNKEFDIKTGFKTRNILCVPMKNIQGEITGVFQILNKINGSFLKSDEEFLAAMASSTGIAIENVLLHVRLKKQLEDVKRSYEELYIAQKQMLKETHFAAANEVAGFIKSRLAETRLIEKAEQLMAVYQDNGHMPKFAQYVKESICRLNSSIDSYIGSLKENFNRK